MKSQDTLFSGFLETLLGWPELPPNTKSTFVIGNTVYLDKGLTIQVDFFSISFSSSNIQFYESQIFCLFTF